MNRIRLVLLVALAVVIQGAAVGLVFLLRDGPSEDPGLAQSQDQSVQLAGDDYPQLEANAPEEISTRVGDLYAALDSMATTGADQTEEIGRFLSGSPDQVAAVVDDYRLRWLGTEGANGAVVPGSARVSRVTLSPRESLAAVVIAETVRLPDGTTAGCLENTVWEVSGGEWCRACWARAYWHVEQGRVPFEEGTQLDGLVWDLARIEETPQTEALKDGYRVVDVTLTIANQGAQAHAPGEYVIFLSSSEGDRYEVSALIDKLHPTMRGEWETPVQRGEEKWFSLVFEIPADVDLASLQHEVVRVLDVAPNQAPPDTEEQAPTPAYPATPQTWALAASAMLMYRDYYRDDVLSGETPGGVSVQECSDSLERWWGVLDRDDLLDVLAWLQAEGHRTSWDELFTRIAGLDEAELREYRADLGDSDEGYQVDAMIKYRSDVGPSGILAFDICRYISLCRWGNYCGYLSDVEAWALVMPAAAELQASFSSWEEVGQSYLMGREFWSHDQTLIDGDAMIGVYMRLLTDPESPWHLNPWDLDLGIDDSGSVS